MKEICEKLNDYQKQDLRMSVDYMGVLDIACGDHSYLFAIARCGQFEKVSHSYAYSYFVCVIELFYKSRIYVHI